MLLTYRRSAENSATLVNLLRLEADAAAGNTYAAVRVGENGESGQGSIEKESQQVRLQIPYLDVIKIARQDPFTGGLSVESQTELSQRRVSTAPNQALASMPIQPPMDEQQASGQMSARPQDSTFPSVQFQALGRHKKPTTQYSHAHHDGDNTLQVNAELPSIVAGIDDWALQGVDLAFFGNLIRATPSIEDAYSSSNM
jgi:hypothetical protein